MSSLREAALAAALERGPVEVARRAAQEILGDAFHIDVADDGKTFTVDGVVFDVVHADEVEHLADLDDPEDPDSTTVPAPTGNSDGMLICWGPHRRIISTLADIGDIFMEMDAVQAAEAVIAKYGPVEPIKMTAVCDSLRRPAVVVNYDDLVSVTVVVADDTTETLGRAVEDVTVRGELRRDKLAAAYSQSCP